MPLLATLETTTRFFAVYPFVGGGELFEFVSLNAPLPESTAKSLHAWYVGRCALLSFGWYLSSRYFFRKISYLGANMQMKHY